MAIAPGVRFDRYEILSLLGKGGMGEVHLAQDTKLGRKIALKLLPVQFTQDADRVRRFIQEAQAASALNHPNIITIYEIGEVEGTHFIATEFIDGQTLRERMNRSPLTLNEALDVATQMVSALSEAHAAGIIHRDIKPENVMVRPNGLVKVLDFGLAKLTEKQARTSDTDAPTSAGNETDPGTVMGTALYMSPEQARGQKVDARTDIFSLGTVLYEMIAGKPPFDGVNAIEMMSAILKTEPAPLKQCVPDLPAELQRIVGKALRKEREQRYQTSKDLLLDLKELKEEVAFASKLQSAAATDSGNKELTAPAIQTAGMSGDTAAATPTQTTSGAEAILTEIKRHKRGVTLALVVLVAVIAGAGWWLSSYIARLQSQARSSGPAARIAPFTSFLGSEYMPSFSPDGNQIAFTWNGEKGAYLDIYVKQIGTEALVRLTTDPATKFLPSWSPDGRYIAFIRQTAEGYGLYLMPSLGGTGRRITELNAQVSLPAWLPDGEWLAIAHRNSPQERSAIFLVARETGEKRKITSPPTESMDDDYPAISPDGKTVAFIRRGRGPEGDLYLAPVAGGEAQRLTFENASLSSPAWTSDGRDILFLTTGSNIGLWKIPATGGKPERVEAAGQNVSSFAISRQGNRLVWSQTFNDSNIWQIELASTTSAESRKQSAKMLISSTKGEISAQFSPDGKRIVFASTRSGNHEIWVCDSDGQHPVQLTSFNRGGTGSPRWSPDGRQIVFESRAEGATAIYLINAEGGKPRRLTTESSQDIAPNWSRDGQWVYFGSNRSGSMQIWKIPAADGQAVQVTRQGGVESMESPDGKFLYYAKGQSVPGIWRMPTADGEETLVLDEHRAGYWRQWDVVEQGIYFATAETPDRPLIEFFNFATRKVTPILTLEKRLPGAISGLSVSPNGRQLIWTQLDQSGSDLMLMENFR